MYRYTDFDRDFVRARARQFRDQLERHLAGTLSADDFGHMRRQNGWYVQRHAPMARVAIPYGTLSATQLRTLAGIARKHDRGYGHFTTRTNIQFNWIPLERAADVMDALAEVGMHGIQTCGNCIRNITADAFAGVAADEIADPRPFCEIMRQWSSLHPEFAALPRKFKIAVNGAREDRAATGWYDVGLQLVRNAAGELVAFRPLSQLRRIFPISENTKYSSLRIDHSFSQNNQSGERALATCRRHRRANGRGEPFCEGLNCAFQEVISAHGLFADCREFAAIKTIIAPDAVYDYSSCFGADFKSVKLADFLEGGVGLLNEAAIGPHGAIHLLHRPVDPIQPCRLFLCGRRNAAD